MAKKVMTTAQKATAAKANINDIISEAIEGTIIATSPTAFTDAHNALKRISAREQKSLADWLTFGRTWCHVRRITNGNKQVMKQMREALFSDDEGRVMVSAQDASYAARMANDWYDIGYYATYVSPHSANPRRVVQGFKAWRELRVRWGVEYVDSVFTTGHVQKSAIAEAAKAIGKEHEVLAIRAAALAAKKAAEKTGSTGNADAIKAAAAAAEKKAAKKNKKAAEKAAEKAVDTNNTDNPSPKPMGVNEAIARMQKIQPVLIAAINTGELKGADLDELDRQVAAIKRAILRAHETAPTVKKAVNA